LGYKKKRLSQNRNDPWWYINKNPDWKDGFPLISQKEFEDPNLDGLSVRSYDDGDAEDFQRQPVQYNDDDYVVTPAGRDIDDDLADVDFFSDDETK
jgi:hypothetical protein